MNKLKFVLCIFVMLFLIKDNSIAHANDMDIWQER